MLLSRMFMIIAAVLIAGGVFETALKEAALDKPKALFLLLCTAVLDRFCLEPAEGVRFSPACVFTAAAAFFFVKSRGRAGRKPLLFLLSAVLGVFGAPLFVSGAEWACYASALLFGSAALWADMGYSVFNPAAAPIIASAAAQLYIWWSYGMAEFGLGDACLASQLASVLTVLAVKELKICRTSVRNASYERPIT